MDEFQQRDIWARRILGVESGAGEEALREAYLRGLREFPPDKEEERFQELREAYDVLRDPQLRVKALFQEVVEDPSIAAWVRAHPAPPRFVGPGPWLEVLKDNKK